MTEEQLEHVRRWMGLEFEPARPPLLSINELRAAVALLVHFGHGSDETARAARQLGGELARRLPAEE